MGKYKFFIAGRARNRENILKICEIFDELKLSYYCFLKEESYSSYGNENQDAETKQKEFESYGLKSEKVIEIWKQKKIQIIFLWFYQQESQDILKLVLHMD